MYEPVSNARKRDEARALRPRWEWSAEEIRRVGYRVVDMIAEHLTTMPEMPVFRPFPAALAAKYLDSTPPEDGQEADVILDTFARDIGPYPFGNGHPRFYGWVNSPPAVMGIFADALAAAMNPSCGGGNHAAVYVEREVINWFKQIVGFPAEGMGLLVSGGSMAALTGLAVARQAQCGYDLRTQGLTGSSARFKFYRTSEGHGCHQKAIELMGIGSENLRNVQHDRSLRMIPSALDDAIREDRQLGDIPIAVIASAGTVNTGAIDPLDEIADVCARHKVWLHVDGAYGAVAILTESYAKQLLPLARADSLALDPHKWLYVPVEAAVVLVRNARHMRGTFSLVQPYLQTDGNAEGVSGLPWFSEYGFQQTRGFRALKVWMALRYHGLSGYRSSIERDIGLTRRLFSLLRSMEDIELFEPQSLSIVCFRYAPPKLHEQAQAIDKLNRTILEKLQLGGHVFLSSTVLDARFWLRACIINPRTCYEDLEELVRNLAASAQSAMAEDHREPTPARRGEKKRAEKG
jgi:aromatic-L-amino-acid/L-tryptophan decarboxylase